MKLRKSIICTYLLLNSRISTGKTPRFEMLFMTSSGFG